MPLNEALSYLDSNIVLKWRIELSRR